MSGAPWQATGSRLLHDDRLRIEEHDIVTIDVAAHELRLDVDPATLAKRRAAWHPPAPKYTSGVWAKYAALVSSASDGAITTGSRLKRALGSAAER